MGLYGQVDINETFWERKNVILPSCSDCPLGMNTCWLGKKQKNIIKSQEIDGTVEMLALPSPVGLPLLWWSNLYFLMEWSFPVVFLTYKYSFPLPAFFTSSFNKSLLRLTVSSVKKWTISDLFKFFFMADNRSPPVNKKIFIKWWGCLSIGGPS